MEQKTKTISPQRLFTIVSLLAVFFCIFSFRLAYLQIFQGSTFKNRSTQNQKRSIGIPANRSIIYDRNKTLKLAYNAYSLAISVIDANLPQDSVERHSQFERMGNILNLTPQQIETIIEENKIDLYTPIVIKANVSTDIISHFAEKIDEYPGVLWENRPQRIYPFKESSFHIVGYTGQINKHEFEEFKSNPLYQLNSTIGKHGIEKQYDELIRGTYGNLLRSVNVRGQVLNQEIARDPIQSDHLVLTVDARMQAKAFELMKNFKGAVVISKVNTGEIITMVSTPSINPDVLQNAIESPEIFRQLVLSPENPFLNRAIQGRYPPASIFKLVSSAAFLRYGIEANKPLQTTGTYDIGDRRFRDWKNHGRLNNMQHAISVSANVYYYHYSQVAGRKSIFDMARDFGFTEPYQLDLPDEKSGFLPNDQWFKKIHKRNWSLGDSANIAIGQGDVLSTPLELNILTSSIANGGTIYRPFILKERLDIKNKEVIWNQQHTPLKTINLPPEHIKVIQDGMIDVIEHPKGTANWLKRYNMISVPIAGKTGTAQTGDPQKDNGLFTAYGPYTDIENAIAITVLLERYRTGESVRIAAQLFNFYFNELYPELKPKST